MSHEDEMPMSVVFALILSLVILLAVINHMCEPEKNGGEGKKIYCKEKTK
tara:strand:+ start:3325 stop:3474 length:150 start_codon:yes stop_codon:yes gene_type:complete